MLLGKFPMYVIVCTVCRNLKKLEEAVLRTEKESEENQKKTQALMEQLSELEERAAKVMNDCTKAEVCMPLQIVF